MTCPCSTFPDVEGTNKFFTKNARRYIKQFQKKGLAKEQQYLVEGMLQSSIKGKTVLEIGCGVGGVHLTLLKQGASFATGIEISEGMIEAAKQFAKELGYESNTRYVLGDFVQTHGSIQRADITVLDKVVCCYENLDALLSKSLNHTTQIYALSYPKPSAIVKMSFQILIFLAAVLKWSFRPYWHDWDRMISTIEHSGFYEQYQRTTLMWSVRIYKRISSSV
jgi:2-polyprenyl-3-methyl-5-hydroxy-6-metoxy-1,4-benzoquinol methylase